MGSLALFQIALELNISLLLFFAKLFKFELEKIIQVFSLTAVLNLLRLKISAVLGCKGADRLVFRFELGNEIFFLGQSILGKVQNCLTVVSPELVKIVCVFLFALRVLLFQLV